MLGFKIRDISIGNKYSVATEMHNNVSYKSDAHGNVIATKLLVSDGDTQAKILVKGQPIIAAISKRKAWKHILKMAKNTDILVLY